jgi:hypothetical protein
MEYWNLQLPIGSTGNPTIIPSSQLQGDNLAVLNGGQAS